MYRWKTSKDGIISSWSLSHKSSIKTTIKSICPVPFSRVFRKISSKLLLMHKFILSKIPCFHYIMNTFWTDAFELWKLFFEAHLIIDAKTTFRIQKPHCVTFWWKHIKNESCKWYLDNKEQKAVFLVVSRTCILVLSTFFFACPIGHANEIA